MSQAEARCTLLLRLAAFFCFAGWTWVHYYWEGPIGVLLWDEHVYRWMEHLGVSWEAFVGSGAEPGRYADQSPGTTETQK